MHVVLGFLGLAVLLVVLVLGMRGAERLMVRLLGLPGFRWFEVGAARAVWWKGFLVRTTSALVPYVMCVTMFFVVNVVSGVPEFTTTINLLTEGAARAAGMRDGDKVLAVGGVPVHTWEELRAQIQTHAAPVQITLERSGQRQALMVTPQGGRIGVTPVSVMRQPSLGEAAERAARLPLQVVADSAKAFVTWHQPGEIKGPVGVVRESGKAARRGWLEVLFFLGVLGSYFWPFVAAVHVFDVATSWTFRLTFTDTGLPDRTVRVAGLRFSMYCALGCWLAMLLFQGAAGAELPGALPLIGLVTPGVWALWPLLWISARELGGKHSPLGTVLPVTIMPCAAPIMGVWLALQLRAEERRLRSHAEG